VNKQDLWWHERQLVRDHYEAGKYRSLIDQFTEKVGPRSFQHELLPVSLANGNFLTPAGEKLALTSSGYDTAIHLSYLQQMFSKLHELIVRGGDA
ncbi:MAG: hypothetical protein F6J87_31590, partial [Spirulina sp. SIO3F2]|nr:hypothetical protein [Spirulina sp. SIO3F2]